MRARVVLLALLHISCGKLNEITDPDGGDGGDPIDPTATLTRVQTEVFTPTCAVIGCHDTLGRQENQILVAGQAYANIVNRPSTQMPQLMRIRPNDPAGSYLYRKVTGAGINGERMPQFGLPLPDAQVRLIRDWIRRGAPND
jgi:hypothetical protein